MPVLTFRNPEGKTIKVNSPDGSLPSEGELDQLFALSAANAPKTGDSSNQDISKRRSILDPMTRGIGEVFGISKHISIPTPDQISESGHPVLGAIAATGRDISAMPLEFFNQMAMNYPKAIARKAGYDLPQAESTAGKVGQIAGGIIGSVKNPVFKMLGIGPGSSLKAVSGAGAIAGGLEAPTENLLGLKQRAINAIGGASFPIAAEGVGRALSKLPEGLKRSAGTIVNSLVKPLLRDFSYGKNPGLAIAQEGITAGSFDELGEKIAQRRKEIGGELGRIVSLPRNSQKTVGLNDSDVIGPLDEALAQARKAPETNKAVINRLEGLKSDILGMGKQVSEKLPDEERASFIIKKGSESRSTTPAIKNVSLAGKAKKGIWKSLQREEPASPFIDPSTGVPVNGSAEGNPQVGKTHLENPEDMVIIPRKNKQATVAFPKTETSIRAQEIQGPSETIEGKTITSRDFSKMSPLEATMLKGDIGDLTKWTGEASDDKIVNKALKKVYGRIKEKIGNAVPEVRKLNERYADLLSAEVATKYRDKIMQRQNLLSLAPKLAGYGSVLAGLASGNPKLIIEGVATIGAEKILSSPIFKTKLASGLNKLGESDALKVLEKYPQLRQLIGRKFKELQEA